MEKQSRTPAEVIEDYNMLMDESYSFFREHGVREYFVDYHDLRGKEHLDVQLGVCASAEELFQSLRAVFTKTFFKDFQLWCYN